MKSKLTIAIVTRKRNKQLKCCLDSIVKQTVLPQTVLIIDNDVRQGAKTTATSFRKILPIHYVTEPKKGTPHARNKALDICKTPFLGFVDDDCILEINWVANSHKALKQHPHTYILGKSQLSNNKNIFALATYFHQAYWFHRNLASNQETSPFNLDTKNIIFRYNSLRKLKVKFDPKIFSDGVDSSDTDLGFQLHVKKVKGVYFSKLVVSHKDTESIYQFFKRAYIRGKLAMLITSKWKLKKGFVDPTSVWLDNFLDSMKLWPKEFSQYTRLTPASFFKKILAFALIKLYERVQLLGYINQAKENGIKLKY